MKKLFILFLFLPFIGFGQTSSELFNGYKYIMIEEVTGVYTKQARRHLVNQLEEIGFHVIHQGMGFVDIPDDLQSNKNLAIFCSMDIRAPWCYEIYLSLKNCDEKLIYSKDVTDCLFVSLGIEKALKDIKELGYRYDSTLTSSGSFYSKKSNNGEWKGNGSGIIISKLGHIITNYHVIADADDIEVEFILKNKKSKN